MDSNESANRLAPHTNCICADTTPRIFAKSERPPLQPNVAVLVHVADSQFASVVLVIAQTRIDFERPFYLTDSFYNLSPKRGPPVL
jgi:hypothetical protein